MYTLGILPGALEVYFIGIIQVYLGILQVYSRYTLGILQVYSRYILQVYSRYILQIYYRYTLSMLQVYCRYTLGMLQVYSRYTLGILQVYHRYILGIYSRYTLGIEQVYTLGILQVQYRYILQVYSRYTLGIVQVYSRYTILQVQKENQSYPLNITRINVTSTGTPRCCYTSPHSPPFLYLNPPPRRSRPPDAVLTPSLFQRIKQPPMVSYSCNIVLFFNLLVIYVKQHEMQFMQEKIKHIFSVIEESKMFILSGMLAHGISDK